MKNGRSKIKLFCQYVFSAHPASIFVDLGSQHESTQATFSAFISYGDVIKIVLLLRWEHNFQGSDPQKSIPRATPNDNGARKRKKSVPAPSPDALFRQQDRFWWTFRLRPGPENHQKLLLSRPRFAPGAQLFAGLVQNACRRPSECRKLPKTKENRPKSAEKKLEYRLHLSKFLQNLSRNSGQKRWASYSQG